MTRYVYNTDMDSESDLLDREADKQARWRELDRVLDRLGERVTTFEQQYATGSLPHTLPQRPVTGDAPPPPSTLPRRKFDFSL